jgi:hypothetical protein
MATKRSDPYRDCKHWWDDLDRIHHLDPATEMLAYLCESPLLTRLHAPFLHSIFSGW